MKNYQDNTSACKQRKVTQVKNKFYHLQLTIDNYYYQFLLCISRNVSIQKACICRYRCHTYSYMHKYTNIPTYIPANENELHICLLYVHFYTNKLILHLYLGENFISAYMNPPHSLYWLPYFMQASWYSYLVPSYQIFRLFSVFLITKNTVNVLSYKSLSNFSSQCISDRYF